MMGPDDDPIFGSIRHMDNMINSMFSDPFGMMGGLMGGHSSLPAPHNQVAQQRPRSHEIAPFGGMFGGGMFGGGMFGGGMFGFPNMNRLFDNMAPIGNDGNCHSFSSSTVMTMSSGPDGQPQVYQSSSTTRSAPGGIKETKKTVCDSRSGVKKMAIGHHIGERAHIIEREKNVYTGEVEQREDLVNLDEDEAPIFNREWEQRTGTIGVGAVTDGRSSRHRNRDQLALPSTAPVSSSTTSSLRAKARAAARARRSQVSLTKPSRVEITEVTDEDDNNANSSSPSEERCASPIIEYPSASHPRREGIAREAYQPRTHIQEHQVREGSRKRDHEDDHEERRRHHKSRKPY